MNVDKEKPLTHEEMYASWPIYKFVYDVFIIDKPYNKRFFFSTELVWCIEQITKTRMPFRFPRYGCKHCHGKGFTGISDTPIFVEKKDFVRRPIPCKCLLETDKNILMEYAKKTKTEKGTPDENFKKIQEQNNANAIL